jgi:hypothetical protein
LYTTTNYKIQHYYSEAFAKGEIVE